jgi:hypothetical protein
MSRFLFFVLLIAVAAMGAHLWINAPKGPADVSSRERNPNDIRILAVTPPDQAARAAEETRKAVSALAGAACVQLSGIAPADLPRAREALSALALGDRLLERRIEDVSRYWVFVPAARDRRAAEVAVAQLRRQGVTEVSIRPDNAISLGVFSSEDAARRFLAQLETRGVHEAEAAPFTRELREVVMLVREPDTETVARITILQRDFPNSQLRAVSCPTS